MRNQQANLQSLLSNQTWRIDNLYAIEPEAGGGIIKFRRNYAQRVFWAAMHWLNVILKSRQHGFSTLIAMHMLDTCLFNKNVTCGIIDKTNDDAKKKLDKIKLAYDSMDREDVHSKGLGDREARTWKLGAGLKEAIRVVKSNENEIVFANGSKIWVGVDLRGGTVQYLHISELGPIAYTNPEKAQKIRAGALNTVHKGSKIVIESTHEGGKSGLNYEMVRTSQKHSKADKLSQMHWKFHFFAWWQDPKNSLPMDEGFKVVVTPDLMEYFAKLNDHGITLSGEQKYWYAMKKMTQKEDMFKEHPSTAEEALNAAVKGAVYAEEMAKLRVEGRILDFEVEPNSPLYCFWDLGDTDYTCMTLMQKVGLDWHVIDYFSWFGQKANFYAQKCFEWERMYGPINCHFMPHDAKQAKRGGTWEQDYRRLRIGKIQVVPRTAEVMIGVKHLRGQLSRFRFHETNCDREFDVNDEIRTPGLLACMEGYRTAWDEKHEVFREKPVKDGFDHGADSMRTWAEAHKKGLIDGIAATPEEEYWQDQRRRNMVDYGSYGNGSFKGVSMGSGNRGRVRY